MKTNRLAALVAALALSLVAAQALGQPTDPPKTESKAEAKKAAPKAASKATPKATPKAVTKKAIAKKPAAKTDAKKPEPKAEAKKEVGIKAAAKDVVKGEAPASQPAAAAVVPTKDVPKEVDPEDATSLVKGIFKAAKGGQWALLAGLVLMLLSWVVNRILKNKIPPKVMPWLSIGLGVAAQIVLTVAAGNAKTADTWITAITGGISLGLAGAGTWSALGKYLPGLKKPKPAGEPTKADS